MDLCTRASCCLRFAGAFPCVTIGAWIEELTTAFEIGERAAFWHGKVDDMISATVKTLSLGLLFIPGFGFVAKFMEATSETPLMVHYKEKGTNAIVRVPRSKKHLAKYVRSHNRTSLARGPAVDHGMDMDDGYTYAWT